MTPKHAHPWARVRPRAHVHPRNVTPASQAHALGALHAHPKRAPRSMLPDECMGTLPDERTESVPPVTYVAMLYEKNWENLL